MTKPQVSPADEATGMRIRLRRKALGITQSQLADAINLTFQQVQKYERGVNRVSSQTLVKIAKKLECTVNFLLCGEEESATTALTPTEQARRDFLNREKGAALVDTLIGLNDRELRFIGFVAAHVRLMRSDAEEAEEASEAEPRLRAVG